jgi:hypothetical protein
MEIREKLFDESGNPSSLLKVIFFTFIIHFLYWLALPHQAVLDRITQVSTLWEAGWFRTVPFEYSKLCVEHRVLPYTKPDLPGYPFKYMEYPFLLGYFSYGIYVLTRGHFSTFYSVFQLINIVFQVGNASLIFLISKHFHTEKRSMFLGFSFSIMPSILWHSMSRYDCIPTFFMLLSLYLFLRGKLRLSYIPMAVGFMFKFFPALLGLIYIKNGYQNRRSLRYYIELVAIPAIIVIASVLPLLVMNPTVLPWLFGFLGGFGWNWESIWGPIDQFIRPVFPFLSFFYINQEWMRVIFAISVLSFLAMNLKSKIDIVNGLAYSILCWLQTQWFFSPQYIVWISPLLLILSFSNKFLALYFIFQLVMFVEIPSPFYYLFPVSQFHLTLIASSIRILLIFVFITLILKDRIIEKINTLLKRNSHQNFQN